LIRSDGSTLPAHLLNQLNNQLNKAEGSLNNFIREGQDQHLNSAREQLEHAAHTANVIPKVRETNALDAQISEIIANQHQQAKSHVAELRNAIDSLNERIEQLSQLLQERRNEQSELKSLIDSQKERIDSVINDFQSQFSEAETSRRNSFDELREQLRQQTSDLIEKLEAKFQSHQEELQSQADSFLQGMRQRDDETKALAHAMGARGISSSFQSTANKNEKAANRLRVLATIFFAIMAVVVIWALRESSWSASLIRISAALILTIPAAYLARESTRQRREATRSRRIELELTALGPFLETLDEDKESELREYLTKIYFGRAFDGTISGDERGVPTVASSVQQAVSGKD
jgi:predicted  nucleic acid-binding Zn-ribbon protein